MIPGSFAYHRPSSVKEAVSLLGSLGDDARAIAGWAQPYSDDEVAAREPLAPY
jgi:hypothetical protein